MASADRAASPGADVMWLAAAGASSLLVQISQERAHSLTGLPRYNICRDWAHPHHICIETGPHACHICTGTYRSCKPPPAHQQTLRQDCGCECVTAWARLLQLQPLLDRSSNEFGIRAEVVCAQVDSLKRRARQHPFRYLSRLLIVERRVLVTAITVLTTAITVLTTAITVLTTFISVFRILCAACCAAPYVGCGTACVLLSMVRPGTPSPGWMSPVRVRMSQQRA